MAFINMEYYNFQAMDKVTNIQPQTCMDKVEIIALLTLNILKLDKKVTCMYEVSRYISILIKSVQLKFYLSNENFDSSKVT